MTKTAFKHVGLIYKRQDMSYEEFVQYWQNVHTKIALQLPGLKGYSINPIDRRLYPDSPIDGFSELWFDSLQSAQQAYDDVPNFAERVAVTYVTEQKQK